jgi:hypothetical protein
MALRVAFDLDGTIADMESALQREAEKLFGPNMQVRPAGIDHPDAPASVDDVADDPTKEVSRDEKKAEKKQVLSGRQLRQLWEHVAGIDNFWMTLIEIEPGSVARIAALRNAHKLEVMFLTQRPDTAGEITQLQTQRWLEAHGFELPSVFVLRGSRGLAAAALQMDVVVDDRPENCLEVVTESKARPLLLWREPIELLPPGAKRFGIEAVPSVIEALRRIETMISNAPKAASFVARLRNVIGI